MTHNRRWSSALWSAAGFPFRLAYRGVIFLVTLIFMGFAYAVGGVPRIEPPEKKNRITEANRR